MEPAQGIIVWLWRCDPRGFERKERAFLIITPTDDIKAGGNVVGVAISTKVSDPPRPHEILLPWHKDRHPKTSLFERSAAICNWFSVINREELNNVKHWCPKKYLLAIFEVINTLPKSSATWSHPPS